MHVVKTRIQSIGLTVIHRFIHSPYSSSISNNNKYNSILTALTVALMSTTTSRTTTTASDSKSDTTTTDIKSDSHKPHPEHHPVLHGDIAADKHADSHAASVRPFEMPAPDITPGLRPIESIPTTPVLTEQQKLLSTIDLASIPIKQLRANNYQLLRSCIGNARVVLIGESSHGTEDFYLIRAEITKALLESDSAFQYIGTESDWPDMYRVNKYVQQVKSIDNTAEDSLGDFLRWPRWMWRNTVIVEFIEWLKQFNAARKLKSATVQQQSDNPESLSHLSIPVGMYGLDLYSLFTSADAVIKYLESIGDKEAAEHARESYSIFAQFQDDIQMYGVSVAYGLITPANEQVLSVLMNLLKKKQQYICNQGTIDGEEYLYSEQNAKLVRDAENYYRNSLSGGATTWNIRDGHMTDTMQDLLKHYDDKLEKKIKEIREGKPSTECASNTTETSMETESTATTATPTATATATATAADSEAPHIDLVDKVQSPPRSKAIIWMHNSHVGDGSATSFGQTREHNIGQLARQRLGLGNTYNIGFTTFNGTVSAGSKWGGSRQTFLVNDALPDSYERLFHELCIKQESTVNQFGLIFRGNHPKSELELKQQKSIIRQSCIRSLSDPIRLERAIGVQYVKKTERQSHYMKCNLPRQFDSIIHLDKTKFLKPLDPDDEQGE